MDAFTFSYKDTCGVNEETIGKKREQLSSYRDHLKEVIADGDYDAPEASVNLISDDAYQKAVREMASEFSKVGSVYVIGIGGSNLGTKAIYDAIRGTMDTYNDALPKLFFADTVSDDLIARMTALISNNTDLGTIAVNLISKSGSTTESIANAEILCAVLEQKFGEEAKRRVVVTTDEDSPLWQRAQELGIKKLAIPKQVGGRYSVFSTVGMFPLALAGFDIDALLAGARGMRDLCIGEDENPAMISAAIAHAMYEEKNRINNNFFFAPELESIGKWYRQLMGESLGKEKNTHGETVHAGIVPVVTIGSADLHSMAQLYLGGPRVMYTTFVRVATPSADAGQVPENGWWKDLVADLPGKRLSNIMDAISQGVTKAYRNAALPFTEVTLSSISERALGAYMQWKMMEMMYLAQLLDVNAFDQPNVEDYKKETREILKQTQA